MSRILIDAFADELKDGSGKVVKDKKSGKPVSLFRPRVKLMEGAKTDSFTLKAWEDIWDSRGNTYTANTGFEVEGRSVPARQVCLKPNGAYDEVEVRAGDGTRVYQITSGLCESFASVATQTRIAQEEIRNSAKMK